MANTWGIARDGVLWGEVAAALATIGLEKEVDVVAGIEAAGFLLGGAVSSILQVGFVPIRRLPDARLAGREYQEETEPDYRGRTHTLRVQAGAGIKGRRVLVVDDWAETGSQLLAAKRLLTTAGAAIVNFAVVVDELTPAVANRLEQYHWLITARSLAAPTPQPAKFGGI